MSKYLKISANTPEEELDRLLHTKRNLTRFKELGLNIEYTEDEEIKRRLEQATEGKCPLTKEQLVELFKEKEYVRSNYDKHINQIEKESVIVDRVIDYLKEISQLWEFKTFEEYNVKVTLYGTGGSYYPKTGTIVQKPKSSRSFNHSISHEIVHIGIEESIVQEYDLNHKEKENVVHLICAVELADYLDNYFPSADSDKFIKFFRDNPPEKGIDWIEYVGKYKASAT